jgi:hypothetical protein
MMDLEGWENMMAGVETGWVIIQFLKEGIITNFLVKT